MSEQPMVLDPTEVLQAQVKESNDMLATALDRSAQYRAAAEYYQRECQRMNAELSEAHATLKEQQELIVTLRAGSEAEPEA